MMPILMGGPSSTRLVGVGSVDNGGRGLFSVGGGLIGGFDAMEGFVGAGKGLGP